ncbi:MAG: hypothetical protein GXO48_04915 [Chlorobi bacterium]|nr:hypothetical protein [Chlorobiota bacterium]
MVVSIDYHYIINIHLNFTLSAVRIGRTISPLVKENEKLVNFRPKKILPGSSEYRLFCVENTINLVTYNALINALSLKVADVIIHPLNILHDYSINDNRYRQIVTLYALTVDSSLFVTEDKYYALKRLYCITNEFSYERFNAYLYNLLACKYLGICTKKVQQVKQCANKINKWWKQYRECLKDGNVKTCHFKSVTFNLLTCVDSLSKNHYTKLVETLFTVRNNLDSVISLWNIDGVILSSAVVNNWKSRCRTCDFNRAINLKLFDDREAVLVPIQNKFN